MSILALILGNRRLALYGVAAAGLLGLYLWVGHIRTENARLTAQASALQTANAESQKTIERQRIDFHAALEQVQGAHETWVAEVKALAASKERISHAKDRDESAGDAGAIALGELRKRRADRANQNGAATTPGRAADVR